MLHYLHRSYLFVIMHHNMQKLNIAALNIFFLALSMSMVALFTLLLFRYRIDNWNQYF